MQSPQRTRFGSRRSEPGYKPFSHFTGSIPIVGSKIISWFKKWLFALSLSTALLLLFSIWLPKSLGWYLYQQDLDLPVGAYLILTFAVAILFAIALAIVAMRPVPQGRGSKAWHYMLLFMTLTLNVIYWLLVLILKNRGVS